MHAATRRAPPSVPTTTIVAALIAERRAVAEATSTTDHDPDTAPTPSTAEILSLAESRARSRGLSKVTPLDVRYAAQTLSTRLKPPNPFVDPVPENHADLTARLATLKASIESGHCRKPRVLSLCDSTGFVARAFADAGCDVAVVGLSPPEDDTLPYVVGDAATFVDAGVDLVVGQPPCTLLTNAGVVWLHRDPSRLPEMLNAADFFLRLMDADAPFVALENPKMHRYARAAIRGLRPTQYVHPWQFGHGETKSIGLFLRGLPPLHPERLVTGRAHVRASLPQSPQRSDLRSRTYLGLAAAMALQWVPVLAEWVRQQPPGTSSPSSSLTTFDLCARTAAASRHQAFDVTTTTAPDSTNPVHVPHVAERADGPSRWICPHGTPHLFETSTPSHTPACRNGRCVLHFRSFVDHRATALPPNATVSRQLASRAPHASRCPPPRRPHGAPAPGGCSAYRPLLRRTPPAAAPAGRARAVGRPLRHPPALTPRRVVGVGPSPPT